MNTAYAYERAVARGLASEATRKQSALQRAINDTVRALRDLFECGVDRDFIEETLTGLHDKVTNADASLRSDIDNAGFVAGEIDLTEAEELLGKVRA